MVTTFLRKHYTYSIINLLFLKCRGNSRKYQKNILFRQAKFDYKKRNFFVSTSP